MLFRRDFFRNNWAIFSDFLVATLFKEDFIIKDLFYSDNYKITLEFIS